ncbi:MAG TPA: PPOX class F420-dependent oxidoreductase [Actinomycetota bacterium]|nr:PPOX class F420-dependent oxidoreductase [Actinomycetota bacterium]
MGTFSEAEVAYLHEQRLGRLATVGADGTPHVVPVAFRYNPEADAIDIGGRRMGRTKKFRDIARTGRAAFVVDDVRPPWRPRMIEIRGEAEALPAGGQTVMESFSPELIRIHPGRIVSWGLDDEAGGARTV